VVVVVKKRKDEMNGSPHQLCCPKCHGTAFAHFIQNIPIAPFIPDMGLAHFIAYQWQVCTTCGWNTGIPPEAKNKREFNKLVEWSRAKQLEGLRRVTYGYKPSQEDINNSFQMVEDAD
jgi:hypothetical protein